MSESNQLAHIWHHCHGCSEAPITGKRHHCDSCADGPDNDLCESCYQLYLAKKLRHPAEDSLSAAHDIKKHVFTVHQGQPLSDFGHYLDIPLPQSTTPSIPNGFVVRPIFNAGMDSVMGGYAFAAKTKDKPGTYLFTALHVMDQLIKQLNINCANKNPNYSGKELPARVTGVNVFDVFAPNWMLAALGEAGPMLTLPNARTGDEEPFSNRDIAIFNASRNIDLNPLPLAQNAPKTGEPVWLAVRSPNNPNKKLFKAVIVEKTDRSLVFRYQDKEIPKYSSGTAIINKNNEVAGIVVGGGKLNNQSLGHANHVENIEKHLKDAR